MFISRRLLPVLLVLSILLLYYRLTSSSSHPSASKMGSAPPPLRLAILETDTPQPQTNAKYGGYAGVFTSLFTSACASLEPPQTLTQQLAIQSYHVVTDVDHPDAYPPLDDIDAILITGSRHNAFDDHEWIVKLVEYTKSAIDSGRVRVVGVCFGHQIVGRAVGSVVSKNDKPWEVSVSDVDLTKEGKEIFQLERMRIHQMHRDIVQSFPPGAIPLGSSPICAVQGMYLPNRYITVQGHPEFTGEIVSEVLYNRHKAGVFDDQLFKSGMDRVNSQHDGVTIARAFLKFMREG